VVNVECDKPSNKTMLYSKKRAKKYKYHGVFFTIQDNVDELRIHFLIVHEYFLMDFIKKMSKLSSISDIYSFLF
jgi:hypothetical protein